MASYVVHEPYLPPRTFTSIGKAKAHMKKKATDHMSFCRKYASDSVIAVGDLLGAIEELNDGSFEHGVVKLAAVVDEHTGVRMSFDVVPA